jgi:hypothetical protein
MSRHATAEDLSAYLDQELPRPQLRLVETHLEECEECRTRFEGLRRVVGKLHRLESMAPPPVLAQQVQRRIALDGGRQAAFLERLERRLGGLPMEPSVGVTFALVFAFAIILYLFGWWVDVRQGGTTILAPPAEVQGEMPLEEVDGRLFELEGDLWIERGLDPAAPVTRLTLEDPEALAVLESYPRLSARISTWVAAGRSVRLISEDGVVEIGQPPKRLP